MGVGMTDNAAELASVSIQRQCMCSILAATSRQQVAFEKGDN